MQILTRQQAIEMGAGRYFTGQPCRNGHLCERSVANCRCMGCNRDYQKRRTEESPEYAARTLARLSLLKRDGKQYYQNRKLNRRATLVLRGAKSRATARGLPFDLTIDWVDQRSRFCELSGLPFKADFGDHDKNPFAPSIDRIDSKKGYTQDNCRVILCCLNLGLAGWGIDEVLPAWQALIDRHKKQT